MLSDELIIGNCNWGKHNVPQHLTNEVWLLSPPPQRAGRMVVFRREKKEALEDVHRVLKKDGIAVLTDFFMANENLSKFTHHENIIRNSPLAITNISHLYDRPWYLLESLVKKTKLQKPLRGLLASVPVAKLLNRAGKFLGRKLSNHIVVIARKTQLKRDAFT